MTRVESTRRRVERCARRYWYWGSKASEPMTRAMFALAKDALAAAAAEHGRAVAEEALRRTRKP